MKPSLDSAHETQYPERMLSHVEPETHRVAQPRPSPTAVSSLAQFRQFQNLLDALAARELRGEPGLVAFADSMDSNDHEPSDEPAWSQLSCLIRKRGLAIRARREASR